MDASQIRTVTVYEFPLNERVRILMRLEHLADCLNELLRRGDALSHHHALQTVFQIADVCEQRTDLKSEILKELERYRQTILGYRSIEGLEQRVNQLLAEIDQCYSRFNSQSGNLSTELNQNEWLLGVRGRIHIPAGLCAFDHPSYFTWQHLSDEQRLRDMAHWQRPLEPIMACVRLLMRLLRDTEVAQKVMTQEGVYQQSLSANKNYQLLRISMQPNMQLVPTVSAHRLMVTIRMMRREGEKMLHAGNVQVGFELALCS